MAARSVPPVPAQKALRVAGIFDVVLGIAMAVFGESFYGAQPPARSDIIEALSRISLRSHLQVAAEAKG